MSLHQWHLVTLRSSFRIYRSDDVSIGGLNVLLQGGSVALPKLCYRRMETHYISIWNHYCTRPPQGYHTHGILPVWSVRTRLDGSPNQVISRSARLSGAARTPQYWADPLSEKSAGPENRGRTRSRRHHAGTSRIHPVQGRAKGNPRLV